MRTTTNRLFLLLCFCLVNFSYLRAGDSIPQRYMTPEIHSWRVLGPTAFPLFNYVSKTVTVDDLNRLGIGPSACDTSWHYTAWKKDGKDTIKALTNAGKYFGWEVVFVDSIRNPLDTAMRYCNGQAVYDFSLYKPGLYIVQFGNYVQKIIK